MDILPLLQIAVQVVGLGFIYWYQRNKIASLKSAVDAQKISIDAQKASLDAQVTTISALKTQADGQSAITTRLEAIVDRTERHATTVLTNHEKLIQLVEDRAAREKQELEDRAEREKQKSEALLEDARGQLSAREETIKGAGMHPELASLLTSLSQESFATKELLTSLKADFSQLVSFNQSLYINSQVKSMEDSANNKANPLTSKKRVYNSDYKEILYRIYDNLNTAAFPNIDVDKQFLKAALENERAFLGQGVPLIINHLIIHLMTAYKNKSGKESNYMDLENYANTLGLGPFSKSA